MPAPRAHPAQAQARRQHLVQRCAVDHAAGPVPRLDAARRAVALQQFGVGVILDQRYAVRGAQLDEGPFVGIGHHGTGRVLQVRHHHHGLDAGAVAQGKFQRVQRDAGLRAGGNLKRLQAQAFKHLQQAIKRGRLHRHHIAGLGDGAQRQVQRLDAAMRDQYLVGRQRQAAGERAAGHGFAEHAVAILRRGRAQQQRLVAHGAGYRLAQRVHRIVLGRGARH
jgi:hypothetical protein